MNIQSRATDSTKIRYADLDIADPFHPILDTVDSTNFQGFDADTTVATAVLSTAQNAEGSIPSECGGFMEAGGSFQSLLRTQSETVQASETILGVCSYYNGGMIVTTMDVATVSARADSSTFPLLGNMLSYQVPPYPNGFGTRGNGLDLTSNGDVLEIDAGTNEYKLRYMKSNADLTFGFSTATTEPLTADWILDGPTAWDGSAMASGMSYSTDNNPTMTFCQADISEVTGCRTGATWTVALMLHDAQGHARTIDIVVETNDLEADEYDPNASAIVVTEDRDYAEQLELTGTKTLPNVDGDWEIYRLTLDEDGETSIDFDAGDSFDQDALSGNGITTYEWTVYNDEPYGEFRSPKGVYVQNAASQGEWTYTFRNVTIDSFGEQEAQIRIELIVTDGADNPSQKFRFYFVVVPDGFGDEEPVVDIDFSANNSRVVEDTISVSGSVLTGAEDETDVFVEIAFEESTFQLTPIQKFNAETDGTFAKTKDGLGDGDSFVLNLSLDGMYSNVSQTQRIFIKIYEYDSSSGERWVTIKWLEVNLAPCQGLEANPDAEAAGGRFVLVDGACAWEGAWTYNPATGEWSAPKDTSGGDEGNSGLSLPLMAGVAVALLIVVVLSLLVLRRGGDDDGVKNVDFSMGMIEQDPVEQYVQQLVAQGYPEETARAHAQQYAGQLGGAAAATQAAAAPAGAGLYEQYYQQYLTQLTQQGYDEATAQQYAAQYAQAALQQQQ